MLASLDQHEQELLRGGGLQVGQVIDEHKASFDRGDFLVRGLLGADPETGSIAVADSVEVGQTLQFHVRDADAADEDLELLLVPVSRWRPRGVLLFSCNGRGRGFFGEPDHDAARVAAATDAAPMAGFFAQGDELRRNPQPTPAPCSRAPRTRCYRPGGYRAAGRPRRPPSSSRSRR
jgi:small ligand-binding sensory domain FIST